MKQTDITSQDFLVWWQNRFPNLASVAAPYARLLTARSLCPESCFTLRVAYFIAQLRNLEDFVDHSQQLDWLSPESRKELLNDLVTLDMDALVKHLSKSPFEVIQHNAIWPVTESLNLKLNKYFDNHRAVLINDMESATGQTVDNLSNKFRLSVAASNVVEHLSLSYVMNFLSFIERADTELSSLKEKLLTPDTSVDPFAKQRYLDFRIVVDRHVKSFDIEIPEIAEEWLYNVLELFEEYPNYFGKQS